MAEFDLVIRGGNLADGFGGDIKASDVGVIDGRVAAVGKNLAGGKQEIDAKGKLVTPGFVDIHTHYDGQASWAECLAPSSWHGVTTAVMGNCGVGFAPVRTQDRGQLIELMEGVEDIPGVALHEGLSWSWESFGDYLNELERRPHDIDFAAHLPHGALRIYVMGDRAARLEDATPEECAQMRKLTAEAMRAGAIGFSTSRTIMHNTSKGAPTPSLRAAQDELMAVAMGMSDAGFGVMEMVSDYGYPDYESEFAMLRNIVAASGRSLSLAVVQNHQKPELWRDILRDIAKANEDGLKFRAQVCPRPIGVLYGLQCTLNPFSFRPSYRAIAKKSVEERLAIMRDPQFRAKLLAEENPVSERTARMPKFDGMFRLGTPPNYEPSPSESIAAQAKATGKDPAEIAYDMLLEDEGRSFIFAPFSNYLERNLDACREMLSHPDSVIGLSDGGAHVGVICDGSFPTTLLSHWGRDRKAGRLDLGFLVKRQTLDTARTVGFTDRGFLAPGAKADINVIDFDRLTVEAPFMAFDLPAGGKRLLQKARGYEATIVSGQVVYRDGVDTGARPGKLVRMRA